MVRVRTRRRRASVSVKRTVRALAGALKVATTLAARLLLGRFIVPGTRRNGNRIGLATRGRGATVAAATGGCADAAALAAAGGAGGAGTGGAGATGLGSGPRAAEGNLVARASWVPAGGAGVTLSGWV